MPGPKKTPPHLKIIKGTLSSRDSRAAAAASTPGLPPLDVAPTPPAWLTKKAARAEWARLAPILVANKLLTDGNVGLLAHLCACHGHLTDIWQHGLKANAALVMNYRTLSNSLGLLALDIPAAKPGNRFTSNTPRRKP